MNHLLSDLHVRRGRLIERIATQRATLGREMRPAYNLLYKVDRLVVRVHLIIDYVKQHPSVVVLGVAGLFFIKIERAWRWAKRGFFAWQTWRALCNRVLVSRLSARS